jgi:hypothetical protein
MLVDATSSIFFVIFYALFCLGFVLQFKEFVGIGLSPDNLLQTRFIRCSEQLQVLKG